MMEYDDDARGADVADRARAFMEDVVIPMDRDRSNDHPVTADEITKLRQAARERDVYAPTISEAYGGLGLDIRSALPTLEQAGRSVLGPPAMRAGSPDQGNAHLLERVGTDAQKERWLRPLVDGAVTSAICISEPPPGAGSDPSMLRTAATRDGDGWTLDGHKWWATGSADADLLLVLARVDGGTALFLVPSDADGVSVVRELTGVGRHGAGGHAELLLEGVHVPEDAVLGGVGDGWAAVGVRSPASRLGRCARWSGMAVRALGVAQAYVSEREAFGEPLSQKGVIQFELADAAASLHAARTFSRRTADRVVAGEQREIDLPACKLVVSRTVREVIETAVQACGAAGVGSDLPLSAFYERVRPTNDRLADIRSKRAIAEKLLEDAADPDELGPLPQFGSPGPRD